MNAIDKALTDIGFNIPNEILHWVFGITRVGDQLLPTTQRHRIRTEVIDARVLVDANLVGGEQMVIPLEGTYRQRLPNGASIYQIAHDRIQGRRIQSVHSVTMGDHRLHGYNSSYYGQTPLTSAVGKIADAHIYNGAEFSNNIRLVGENAVLIEDDYYVNQLYLRCVVTNDDQLSNFSPRAVPALSKLCILATKAHIYVNSAVAIDAGILSGGMPLGRFREIIDSYTDANAQYDEYLNNTFAKVSFQQDREAHMRHLRAITGGSLL